ncbi:MAG: addiction module toxin RelE [Nanoarchaeota archaeon]|nr:addiction module toxin RelE [Nanoarchaeota archaeon]
MFDFSYDDILKKKLQKFSKKDKDLAKNIFKKVEEIINQDVNSIDTYKNLVSPMNEFKRIHLTGSYILLFKVYKSKNFILFVDVVHRDDAYKVKK